MLNGNICFVVKYSAARGIGETSGSVQLNGFLGKYFIFRICLFKVYLCIIFFICQTTFFYLTIFQR